jgi:hypothetical protein
MPDNAYHRAACDNTDSGANADSGDIAVFYPGIVASERSLTKNSLFFRYRINGAVHDPLN